MKTEKVPQQRGTFVRYGDHMLNDVWETATHTAKFTIAIPMSQANPSQWNGSPFEGRKINSRPFLSETEE
jgi:hypothetical protein